MSRKGRIGRNSGIARFTARGVIYASIVMLLDYAILAILERAVSKPTLTLVLFLEGGLGLLAGVGVSLSSTPSMTRIGEELFGTSSWSKENQRHAEAIGLKWMLASAFLVAFGFAISAI